MKVTPITRITPVDIYARRLAQQARLGKIKRRPRHIGEFAARQLRYAVKVG